MQQREGEALTSVRSHRSQHKSPVAGEEGSHDVQKADGVLDHICVALKAGGRLEEELAELLPIKLDQRPDGLQHGILHRIVTRILLSLHVN